MTMKARSPLVLSYLCLLLQLLLLSAAAASRPGVARSYCDASTPAASAAAADHRHLRSDRLTVLVSGYSARRLPLLRTLAVSYSLHPAVAAVLVLWGDPSTPSRTLTRRLGFPILDPDDVDAVGSPPVAIFRNPTQSLNDRFLPLRAIRTRAVAVCDDDVEVDAKSLSFALSVWETSSAHQDRIVGFFARSHDLDLERREWIYTVHPHKYSIMLTKFMILRADYLYQYSCGNGNFAEAREVVDRARNCEDILMNFLVAGVAGKGPVLVEGKKVRDWGDTRNDKARGRSPTNSATGHAGGGGEERKNQDAKDVHDVAISMAEGHRKRRGECIQEFHRVLGAMSLRFSYGKVVQEVREQGLCRKGGKLVFCDRFS